MRGVRRSPSNVERPPLKLLDFAFRVQGRVGGRKHRSNGHLPDEMLGCFESIQTVRGTYADLLIAERRACPPMNAR